MALPHEYVNAICEKYCCFLREIAPPEYLSCALALRTLAHLGRLKREGRELRRKRLAEGLSKGQAARRCGVSRREYGRWESGEERAPEGVAERIGGKSMMTHMGVMVARQNQATDDRILPPPERGQHDPLELVDIRDREGWPVQTHRTVDTLGRLLRNNVIGPAEAKAGNRFRAEFHRAKLDPARAPDIRRIPTHGRRSGTSNKVEDAKEGVWLAMLALGGMAAPSASAVWFIIGADFTVREWAQRQSFGRGVSLRHEVATGILVGALGSLVAHYEELDRGVLD